MPHTRDALLYVLDALESCEDDYDSEENFYQRFDQDKIDAAKAIIKQFLDADAVESNYRG